MFDNPVIPGHQVRTEPVRWHVDGEHSAPHPSSRHFRQVDGSAGSASGDSGVIITRQDIVVPVKDRDRMPGRHAMNRTGLPGRWNKATAYAKPMCRNIRTLYNFEPPATHDEVEAAALQYVRKISGFTKPSTVNEAAFEAAIAEISAASARLLDSLQTTAQPKDREVEAAKRKAASAARFAA